MAALRRFGLFLTLSICIACSIADRNSDTFSKPPGGAYGNFALNAVYQASEDVEFAWSYGLNPVDLLLERVDLSNLSATPRKWVLKSAVRTQNYTWTPDGREEYLNNPDDSGPDTVFVASLSYVGANETIMRSPSHYFNVTQAAPASASTPSQVDESSKPGLSAATIAGIAISAVLIFVAVLGTLLLLFWRRSRRAKRPHRLPSQTSSMRDVLSAPKSMDEDATAKASCSSSSSSSSSRDSCNEERHAELHAQNVVIAELPGSCWTDFTPELPGVWRIRRSGDSWEPDALERLDVRPCNAAQRDSFRLDEKTDLEKGDDEDKDEGTEDTGRPATPPPEYATCGSHTLEPFIFNSLEYQLPVKEQQTDSNI